MEAALRLVPEMPDDFDGQFSEANFAIAMRRLSELEAQVQQQAAELMKARTRRSTDDLEDELQGAYLTIKAQNRKLGTLERKLADDDPEHHPQRREIVALIELWKEKCGHGNAKASKDRFDLIRARLKDGYSIEQIELAIEGLGAFRYVVNAQRKREGKESQRYDQLKHALKGGQELERFANLGHQIRKAEA